jgi:hypothetical protein
VPLIAGEIALTVVNIETPQGVKIWEPPTIVAKGGATPRDIARTLFTGLDGTPMPSYHLILDDDELWDLAYYVDSLGTPPVVTDDERAGWHVVGMHQHRGPAPPR